MWWWWDLPPFNGVVWKGPLKSEGASRVLLGKEHLWQREQQRQSPKVQGTSGACEHEGGQGLVSWEGQISWDTWQAAVRVSVFIFSEMGNAWMV